MFSFAAPSLMSLQRGSLSSFTGTFALRSNLRPPLRQQRTTLPQRSLASMSATPSTLGFIGLGVMGLGMAANLANKGIGNLVVWNRSPARFDALEKAIASGPRSAMWASTAAEVIDRCDVTFAMLSTPAAVDAVFHKGGALNAIAPGKALIDCSTLTTDDMRHTAAAVHAQGGRFLEAPVSGSKVPAETGTLIFLCAGERALYDTVKPALDAMGKRAFFLGDEVGNGTKMKLIVNQIMSTTLAALAEGIALSEAIGISVNDLLEVLDLGATGNSMFNIKGPGMKAESKNYNVNFPLEHAHKDMIFAQSLGNEKGVDMAVSAAATKWYKEAKDMGLGREDFSAVMESVRAAAMKAAMK